MREAENRASRSIKKILARSETAVLIATIILIILFSASSDSFLSTYNIFNISRTAAIYIFIALGQAVVILVGGVNLSLGQIGGLSVIVAGYFMEVRGFPTIAGVLTGLAVGLICGLMNGILVIKLKLSGFIVTLATSFVFAGLITGISGGFPYTKLPPDFSIIGTKGIANAVPYLIILAAGALILVWYVFKYTVVGRRLLATGGNIEAARLAGVNTNRMLIIAYMASGFLAAVTGLLWTSRISAAQPSTGSDWMLISFAVAVIGGTSLLGGTISAVGIFISGYLMVMIRNGLVMLNANVYLEQTYLGIIILIAVSLDSIRALVEGRRLRRMLMKKDNKDNVAAGRRAENHDERKGRAS